MIWTAEALAVIDQRIRAAQAVDRAVGTVASVQGDMLRATVTFDGSDLAVPVKVAGHVSPIAGDRVLLERFGSDWVIMGGHVLRWPGLTVINAAAPTGTTTSGTFTALPGSPAGTFRKRWDSTVVRLDVAVSLDSDTNSTGAELGIALGATTYAVVARFFTVGNVRGFAGGTASVPGIPAGTYAAALMWRRYTGAGTLRQFTGGDWDSAAITEARTA